MFPQGLGTAPADVMVTIWNLNGVPDALGLAAELRSGGLRVEVYPEADKIGKQFKYASSRAIPFVTVVGDDEAGEGRGDAQDPGNRRAAGRSTGVMSRHRGEAEFLNMAEQLGSLARTHTCGALRATDVGAQAVLLGWVHRVRDLGALLFVDVRDRHGITQVIVEGDEALLERAKRLRSEFVVAFIGEVERRSPETVNLNVPTGEVEVRARELRVLNEAKTPPFSIAEDQNVSEETRLRYRYLDLRRPTAAAEHRPAAPHHDGDSKVLRRAGVLRDRDADPHEVHARGRARLPRAQPRAPGRVLRVAAVAADLQADPDDCRLRPLRADCPLLPRRGAARRSAARIHAGGPRDGVCDAAAGVRDRRGRAGRLLPGDRRRDSAAVPSHAVRRGDGQVRDRQAGPALRSRNSGLPRRVCGVAVRHLPRGGRARRHGARLRDSRRRRLLPPRSRSTGGTGQAAGCRRPRLGTLHRGRRAIVGQGDGRGRHPPRADRSRRRRRPTWWCSRQAHPTLSRRCSDSSGCKWPSRRSWCRMGSGS